MYLPTAWTWLRGRAAFASAASSNGGPTCRDATTRDSSFPSLRRSTIDGGVDAHCSERRPAASTADGASVVVVARTTSSARREARTPRRGGGGIARVACDEIDPRRGRGAVPFFRGVSRRDVDA
eukprot:31447-Pelagococcus_subviridis.AAC.4